MIPLPLLTKIPWKLIGWAALGLALLALGWRISVWRDSHVRALPEALQSLKAERACEDGSQCAKRVAELTVRQAVISQQVVSNYEAELEALRARPVRTRTVRLCPEATDRDVRIPAPSGGTGKGTAPAGLVPGGTGPGADIGPALYGIADRADELSAQCRAIIRRDVALAQPGE